jgi:hypothetical protein
LNSKNQEEVMKRRAKLSSARVNVYQKGVLLAGVITLFLAITVTAAMAPLLAAGTVGGTLLLFFLLKSPQPKRDEPESIQPAEILSPVDEAGPGEQEILLREEDIVTPDSPAIVLRQEEAAEAEEPPREAKKKTVRKEEIQLQEPVPSGKEGLKDPQEFSGNGPLVQIQERLVKMEEKAINLEEMVLQLVEKVDDLRKTYARKEPKIDLQTMLSDIEENPEKMVQ